MQYATPHSLLPGTEPPKNTISTTRQREQVTTQEISVPRENHMTLQPKPMARAKQRTIRPKRQRNSTSRNAGGKRENGKNRDRQSVRVVSFSDEIRVHHTIHISEYTQQEIQDCWFRRDELPHKATKVHPDKPKELPSCNPCGMSLNDAMTIKSVTRRQFVRSLLDQQHEFLNAAGTIDSKGLCLLSKACSKNAKASARKDALQIAEEVLSLLDLDDL